jgi:hypothetical protein
MTNGRPVLLALRLRVEDQRRVDQIEVVHAR